MSDRVHGLLRRDLQEVLGEDDSTRRRVAIEALSTNDCAVYSP